VQVEGLSRDGQPVGINQTKSHLKLGRQWVMGTPADARGLARDTWTMAIGTVASRVTGFLRLAMLVAVLGVGGVRQALEVSNTLPNSLYDLRPVVRVTVV